MERKFASKLSKKPAAEARKQTRLKQIEPIDYDSYVEQNNSSIRKDACSKDLILLPEDDLIETASTKEQIEKTNLIQSLFVNDCLKTYCQNKYEIKYKYNKFGGNYKQLPSYEENLKKFNETVKNFSNTKCMYEVDIEDSSEQNAERFFSPNNNKLLSKLSSNQLEKHGWLNYRIFISTNDSSKEKGFKKRYFYLRACNSNSPQSRSNSINNRGSATQSSLSIRRQPSQPVQQYQQNNQSLGRNFRHPNYVLECFKDVKRNENPKNQIYFNPHNEISIRKITTDQNGQYTFEIVEKICKKDSNPLYQNHIFMTDNLKQFDEWFSILESIIYFNNNYHTNETYRSKMNYKSTPLSIISSPSTASSASNSIILTKSNNDNNSIEDSNSSSISLPKDSHLAKGEDLNTESLNESLNSSTNENSVTTDQLKLSKISQNESVNFVNNFSMNKYLSENESDLLSNIECENPIHSVNTFDLYSTKENMLPNEETELECENHLEKHASAQKLLMNCIQFKLNLTLPSISFCHTVSNKQHSTTNPGTPKLSTQSFNLNSRSDSLSLNTVNPELFYLTFALYDIKSNQKISANFNWIPNYESYLSNITKSVSIMTLQNKKNISNGTLVAATAATSTNQSTKANSSNSSVFSLDGRRFISENPESALNLDCLNIKKGFMNQITRAVFTIPDVHEDIYLVVRIEKILDGANLHSAISPYLNSLNDSNKLKLALKINKKINQLLKTKLASYRQPFAWAAKSIYKRVNLNQINKNKIMFEYQIDNETQFSIYEQDPQHLSDDDLLKYLTDLRNKERYLNKMMPVSGNIKLTLFSAAENSLDPTLMINSSLDLFRSERQIISYDKLDQYVINVDHFDPVINFDSTVLNTLISSNQNGSAEDAIELSSEQKNLLKKARILKSTNEFKSLLFVYPKFLRYDTQKTFAKARNILIKTEFRERDVVDNGQKLPTLKCIYKTNPGLDSLNNENSLFVYDHYTPVTYHNKTPHFYDEIKILLPLNLTERHHILFKFYHVSCANAKSAELLVDTPLDPNSTLNSMHSVSLNSNKNVESFIGYAWLPIYKNGRLLNGEKMLPIAQNISNNYLSYEQIGTGQNIGPNDIKWVENMRPLFKVNVVASSTVHTTDQHVANFYLQYEKLMASISSNNNGLSSQIQNSGSENKENNFNTISLSSKITKRVAPIFNQEVIEKSDGKSTAKEIIRSSNKMPINMLWSKPAKEELSLSYHLKALHATDLSTIVKFMPTLFNRVLNTLSSTVSGDVAMNSVKTLLHFAWQITLIGKINALKSFVKHTFYVDYSHNFKTKKSTTFPTIHDEIISSLVLFIKQNSPIIQDIPLTIRLLKNCWFFFEITIKSLCIYKIQYEKYCAESNHSSSSSPFSSQEEFYNSLRTLYELLIELLIKNGFQSTTTTSNVQSPTNNLNLSSNAEFVNACKICNRSLAIFIKKSLNILNRKFLFNLVNKYLEYFNLCDKKLLEFKFDFIRIICSHEHFVSFSLPIITKCISNINDYAELKYEFYLSDQYRQFHFMSGVLISQICLSLNESNREQRKIAIQLLVNILKKHSYDSRYNQDKMKLARIALLYAPLIDALIDNMHRMNPSSTQNQTNTKALQMNININNQSLLSSSGENGSSSVLSRTISTITNSINQFSTNTNASLNGFSIDNFRMITNSNDPLSLIAGIVNPNKINNLNGNGDNNSDSIIATVAALGGDSDSLSSADDPSFKKQRLCTSSTASNSENNAPISSGGGTTSSLAHNNTILSHNQVTNVLLQTRKDKLEATEVKDLLMCAIFILKNLSEEALLGLWYNYDDNEFVEFLSLLELCLKTFRYRGKTNIKKLNAISKSGQKDVKKAHVDSSHHQNKTEEEQNDAVFIEARLCHQTSSVILDIISLVLIHEKEKYCDNHGENQIMIKLIEIYFYLLQSNQSEFVKLRVLGSFRYLVQKSSQIFFNLNSSNLCFNFCLEILKCFSSKLSTVRSEACVLIYLLIRKNYEITKMKSISRVHSQIIISISQLIGAMKLTSTHDVLECLSMLNRLAAKDTQFSNTTRLTLEIEDLTRRIRTIFMATSQMKFFYDEQHDCEMLIDLQYSLAKSYANCVELRKTWLDSMASIHFKEKNFSEAAHCFLHISALISENLMHQGLYTLGLNVFKKISQNIELDEDINSRNCELDANDTNGNYSFSSMMLDSNETQYTQADLLNYLSRTAEMFKLGERYDFLPDIFKLAIAIYETNNDYVHLQQMHQNIQKAYSYLAERDQRVSHRDKPLAAYYRVSFFGQLFENENNKVYIYKEPCNTKLFEICERLRKLYTNRYGGLYNMNNNQEDNNIEILCDSRKPAELKLDTANKNYIQVTYVQPYFEDLCYVNYESNDITARSLSYFERNNNLKRFYYETPYKMKEIVENTSDETKSIALSPHAELLNLCKRKFILETSNWFPYVKKRIQVIYEKPVDLNPLETAIDEIRQKVEEFDTILKKKDHTLLELYLQGGIMPQVHKGPLAYAEAFLDLNEANAIYPKELKRKFKLIFKRLIDLYQLGIDLYIQLVSTKFNEESQSIINGANNQPPNGSASINSGANKNINIIANLNANNLTEANQKYVEMHRLLQEKFNELENSFRNLLLLSDEDMDLYHQMSMNVKGSRNSQFTVGLSMSGLNSSSQA